MYRAAAALLVVVAFVVVSAAAFINIVANRNANCILVLFVFLLRHIHCGYVAHTLEMTVMLMFIMFCNCSSEYCLLEFAAPSLFF